ncbi:MAG: succinylglutamate desuccinylase/aspartoacylase family protein [Bdellovibrionales bacterium]|nr:succinylglutamate desuccinylase/aspartoacylase family protein [Bdellovibrionales bacterium]
MKFCTVVAAIFLSCIVGSGAFGSDLPKEILGVDSDSGIHGPPYADLVKYFQALPAKYPGFVQVNQFGTTPKGRPQVVVRVAFPQQYRNKFATNPAIEVSGSIHGDEYLNIEDRLPEWFLSEGIHTPEIQPFFKAGGMIYFIPIINPDGYDARERENSHGTDLNRDFMVKAGHVAGFKEPETQAIRNMLTTQIQTNNQRLVITFDYHCCIGAALYPWSFTNAPQLPQADLARFRIAGQIIKGQFGAKFPVGRTPDILGYSAYGTTKDYFYESFGATSFTYEGERGKEDKKFAQHTQMWKQLIQALGTR